MNFLRGFIIFASLAVATIQAQASTRPDDYEAEEVLDCNFKVLLETIKENKEQIMNQIKLMDEKNEHIYKLVNEEKNGKTEFQEKILELNQKIIEDENELSKLKSTIVQLNQSLIEEQNTTALLQSKNLELNQRLIEEQNSTTTLLQSKNRELNKRIKEWCGGQILDKDGTENIFEASKNGSLNGVKYWYCKNPYSIHAKNTAHLNLTPLHYASAKGQLDVVEFFLSKGVDLEAGGSFFNASPLMYASMYGHVPTVKALLDKGANINHQTNGKDTPLHWAVDYDKLEIVKFLIERGADRSLTNKNNRTPLDLAREKGYKSIEDYLSSL